jgi:ABC-type transport system substrate-binding protein
MSNKKRTVLTVLLVAVGGGIACCIINSLSVLAQEQTAEPQTAPVQAASEQPQMTLDQAMANLAVAVDGFQCTGPQRRVLEQSYMTIRAALARLSALEKLVPAATPEPSQGATEGDSKP